MIAKTIFESKKYDQMLQRKKYLKFNEEDMDLSYLRIFNFAHEIVSYEFITYTVTYIVNNRLPLLKKSYFKLITLRGYHCICSGIYFSRDRCTRYVYGVLPSMFTFIFYNEYHPLTVVLFLSIKFSIQLDKR